MSQRRNGSGHTAGRCRADLGSRVMTTPPHGWTRLASSVRRNAGRVLSDRIASLTGTSTRTPFAADKHTEFPFTRGRGRDHEWSNRDRDSWDGLVQFGSLVTGWLTTCRGGTESSTATPTDSGTATTPRSSRSTGAARRTWRGRPAVQCGTYILGNGQSKLYRPRCCAPVSPASREA